MMHDSYGNPLFRPAWATIDLGALIHNYRVLRDLIPANVGIMAMVKADAYGHGAVPVARALAHAGVRALGVATVEEGMELRQAAITAPILVMTGLMGMGSPASERMVEAELTPVIHSHGVLESLENAAAKAGRIVPVHLKVDTGMSRLGVRPEALPRVLAGLKACPHLRVEGVMTHMADAADEACYDGQMELFLTLRAEIESQIGAVAVWHVANSIAAIAHRDYCPKDVRECWIRPGLALYGECEVDHPAKAALKNVMSLHSRIMLLKRVPAGSRVSYGGTYETKRDSRLAVVPIGYADGYPWSASNKGAHWCAGIACRWRAA